MKEICLDTGVLSILCSATPTNQVRNLFESIAKGNIMGSIPKPVIIELIRHLCQNDGKEIAKVTIVNLLNKYPLNLVEFDQNLLITSGILKCQHINSLSYIDCMGIALALSRNIPFHTTEKKLKALPHNLLNRLTVVEYLF